MKAFVVSISNEKSLNQKERLMYEFEMAFKKSLSSSLKMMTLFLPIPGLKTGVNVRRPAL